MENKINQSEELKNQKHNNIIAGCGIILFIFVIVSLFIALVDDDQDNSSPKIEQETIIDNEVKQKQEKSVVFREEAEAINLHEDTEKEEIVEIEEKDFVIYDEFFSIREQQLKKLDQVLSGISSTRRKTLVDMDDVSDTPEYNALLKIQNIFYEYEKKLDKNNSLHKIIAEAIDYYSDGCVASYKNLLSYKDTSESEDKEIEEAIRKINEVLNSVDNEETATEQREKGDQRTEELLKLLKNNGYDRDIDLKISSEKQQTQVSQTKGYKQIFSFNGEGAKNSETFTISGSKFKIKYDCMETTMTPLCQAVLRSPNDENLYKEIFNIIGETRSETVFYEKGNFYIEATVMGGEFDIIVEEYK